MIVGVPKERYPGERRVALVPAVLPALVRAGLEVVVEEGAGLAAGFPDALYTERGARVLSGRADVFAAASPRYPLGLHEEGLVAEPVVFATNRLVLIVPADEPAGIASFEDLREPGVALVIGAEGVPVGDYTRAALENLGATDVLDRVVSEEQDGKGVVAKVRLGEADAGFVYATDARAAGSSSGARTSDAGPAASMLRWR